jgi:tRNA nucleotidyltransferase/poly(A) polymerase
MTEERLKQKLETLKFLPLLKKIGEAADQLNVQAYTVGGFVRDLILDRPCKDIDFVCVGSGIELAKKAAEVLEVSDKVTTFKNFGTAQVLYKDLELEFVGARKESYDRGSRKPVVEDGTLEDDQNRRDFTINAMAIGLNSKNFGAFVDPFNGLQDIDRKTLRTPLDPAITFEDDPLRMMRAIRFAAQLNYDIDPDTFDQIIEKAHRLEIVSVERIVVEFNKILLSDQPSYGIKLLDVSGLLQHILPELLELKGAEIKDGVQHKNNFYHTLQVVDNIAPNTNNLWLRWATLLHDIAKPRVKRFSKKHGWTFHGHEERGGKMVPGIFRRLKLPLNESMQYVKKLVRLHQRPIALAQEGITDSAIRRIMFEAGEDIDDLLTLCRADITSKNKNKVKRYLKNYDQLEKRIAEIEESDKLRNWQPVVTGEMIMKTFNLEPSPLVGKLKQEIREAILDGQIKNELPEARNFLLSLGEKEGLTVADNQNLS